MCSDKVLSGHFYVKESMVQICLNGLKIQIFRIFPKCVLKFFQLIYLSLLNIVFLTILDKRQLFNFFFLQNPCTHSTTHITAIDNYFNSTKLCRKLRQNEIGVVRTVSTDRTEGALETQVPANDDGLKKKRKRCNMKKPMKRGDMNSVDDGDATWQWYSGWTMA